MATLTCTSCGLRGSDTDEFCTRCGMSRTGTPARGSGSRPGSKVGMWIAIAVAAGFGGIVVIGILAAIAIPRFAAAGASERAREAEARPVLKHIHALQQEFHTRNGRYAANLTDPAAPDFLTGYEDPGARYFVFRVAEATDTELCVDARPNTAGMKMGVTKTSIDEAGQVYLGHGCSGTRMTHTDDASGDAEWVPTAEGEGGKPAVKKP